MACIRPRPKIDWERDSEDTAPYQKPSCPTPVPPSPAGSGSPAGGGSPTSGRATPLPWPIGHQDAGVVNRPRIYRPPPSRPSRPLTCSSPPSSSSRPTSSRPTWRPSTKPHGTNLDSHAESPEFGPAPPVVSYQPTAPVQLEHRSISEPNRSDPDHVKASMDAGHEQGHANCRTDHSAPSNTLIMVTGGDGSAGKGREPWSLGVALTFDVAAVATGAHPKLVQLAEGSYWLHLDGRNYQPCIARPDNRGRGC